MNKKTEFLQKLHSLMNEYEVSFGFSVGESSDTHGLYDEKIVIHQLKNDAKTPWDEEEIFSVEGWWLTSSDLEEEI